MNYPKMLYKSTNVAQYTDTATIGEDLAASRLKTYIVADEDQELTKREDGWVDLCDLMKKPEVKKPPAKAQDGRTHAA